MAETDFHVLIIGAGSTGLLLAQGLKQHNIKATVYEREDPETYQHRPREWGMTLHWGAKMIEKCIPPDMQSKLNESICCDPFYGAKDLTLPHYNAQTGEKLFDMPGHEPRRVSRRKLRNFLAQGVEVQNGKRLKSISKTTDGTITATFDDNTTASGTVLIGCDGAKSATRTAFLGPEKAQLDDLDIQMFNLSCSFPADIALLQRNAGHPIFKNSYHPKGFMWWQSIQDVQDPEEPETWLFQNIISWIGAPRPEDLPDQKTRLEFWQTVAKDFADPWRTVGASLTEDLVWQTDRTAIYKPFDWSGEELGHLVTLAGDAAHAIPAHRGQGLNNALEDAAKLVTELTLAASNQKSLSAALRAYEADMLARMEVEIPLSVAQAQMVHSYDTLMDAPFFKHGMNKYREERGAMGLGLEGAMEEKVQV